MEKLKLTEKEETIVKTGKKETKKKRIVKDLSDFIILNKDGFRVFMLDTWMLYMELNRDDYTTITLRAKTKQFEFDTTVDFSSQIVKFLDDSGCLEEIAFVTYYHRGWEYERWLELNEGYSAR